MTFSCSLFKKYGVIYKFAMMYICRTRNKICVESPIKINKDIINVSNNIGLVHRRYFSAPDAKCYAIYAFNFTLNALGKTTTYSTNIKHSPQ